MGHLVNTDREYHLLQERLDRNVTGAPESPTFMKILRLLFTPEQAVLANKLPTKFTSIRKLAAKLGEPEDLLAERFTRMAERGLIFDMEHNGRRYVALAPVVIGFFEFTFMRAREDLPMAELAKLFDEYMYADDRFSHSIFAGQTQIGRSLVHEEAIVAGDHVEILDWERSVKVVENARKVAVSLCACRHKATHLGHACKRDLRTCLTLNYGVDMLAPHGLTEEITKDEALRILRYAKENGLAQTGDNVKSGMTYMCNCCGCCCGMMNAVRTFGIKSAIVSSNFIMQPDEDKCRGCGKCVKACPVKALSLVDIEPRFIEVGDASIEDPATSRAFTATSRTPRSGRRRAR